MDNQTNIGKDKKKFNNKLYIAIAGIVIILGVGFFLTARYINDRNSVTDICSKPQNAKLMMKAASIIPNYYGGLALNPIAQKITTLPGYDRDPSCLYVVFENTIFTDNLKNSEYYLNQYHKFYNPSKGLAFDLGDHSYQSLKTQLTLYKIGIASTKNDDGAFTRPD